MLALRRVSPIYQYLHPLSSYQYRLKSKKSTNDQSKQKAPSLSKELLEFELKDSNTSSKKQSIPREKLLSTDVDHQTEDLLRSLNVKNLDRRKKSPDEHKLNLAKPFDLKEKKQKTKKRRRTKTKKISSKCYS